ncbi:MAG: hypothetical protein ABI042_00610 [Verrucomicrobiota bacterium]
MSTVLSHIVQKRFSQEYENIATDALAFIVNSNELAKRGLMKLLRGVDADLPNLHFRTQETEENARPDMWGFDGIVPRVFVENKFWAGLTENQPVTYLERLAKNSQSSVLLVIVPAAREATVWRELNQRLADSNVLTSRRDNSVGISCCLGTDLGPALALTSWSKLLSAIQAEIKDELQANNDLLQLRALCDSADSQAFQPISSAEVTDQTTPTFILQLGEIVETAVSLADAEGILSKGTLKPQSDSTRTGRYAWFPNRNGAGIWFGIHFELWREYGGTPLWLIFSNGNYGRADEVRGWLEQWCATNGVFAAYGDRQFAVAIKLVTGEEKDHVVKSVVNQLKKIAEALSKLPPLDRPR